MYFLEDTHIASFIVDEWSWKVLISTGRPWAKSGHLSINYEHMSSYQSPKEPTKSL